MKINLATNNFSFFKVLSGTLLLGGAFFSPFVVAGYSLIVALIVGKAHALGAWLAMWRAGKFNWIYVSAMCLITVVVTFWGSLASLPVLNFVTYILFAFHFFFDEFDLQEEKRSGHNALAGISPFLLSFLYLVKDYYHLAFPSEIFILLASILLLAELVFVKEINWFFIQTKLLTFFILGSIFSGVPANSILSILLVYHYFFWFVYPVYKLHKYKREERDGLIMILLLIIAASVFASSRSSYSPEFMDFSIRVFLIGTIIHIFSTAPFGYLFALPRPQRS